jgi:enoyl-CoA hydratase/3-hydroxyacyl-CoA dehydrogenase
MQRVRTVLRHMEPNLVAGEQKKASPGPLVSIASVENGVAVLLLNNPPVNSLSQELVAQLKSCYDEALENDSVRAMVITGANNYFMAGADIPGLQNTQAMFGRANEVPDVFKDELKSNNLLMGRIENGLKPVVAACSGPAFGGGLELAMSCAARVGLPSGQFSLPEVNLGLFPGMGGTQRLPRLIGVEPAVKAMMSGKPINAKDALKMGLVDTVVKDAKELLPAAVKLALAIADGKAPRNKSMKLTHRLKSQDEDLLAVSAARIAARKNGGNLPHQPACLEAIEVSCYSAQFMSNVYRIIRWD